MADPAAVPSEAPALAADESRAAAAPAVAPGDDARARRGWGRRAALWTLLVALLLVAQSLLVVLTIRHEATRAQDEVDGIAAEAAVAVRRDVATSLRTMQSLLWVGPLLDTWQLGANDLLRSQSELLRLEMRDAEMRVRDAVDGPGSPRPFALIARDELDVETKVACGAARLTNAAVFSRTYFVPLGDGRGGEVIDVCIPVTPGGRNAGFLVGTFSLARLLESAMTPRQARQHEFSFVEGDGTRLARAGLQRGAGVFHAERPVDLPGATLRLRVDSVASRPGLIPNLTTALVLGLSLALFAVVLLLARDVRRRAAAERALAEALAFRQAMEDSLVTGLRARDLRGRITYTNPAFRAMVGFDDDELGRWPPPYWPPEFVDEYARRQRAMMDGGQPAGRESREGFETVFQRRGGERFPVMIYEAPLVDGQGRQAGWMSAVLDLSAQRRAEELSRQQQDRLQATARLATVGEMASLLSHELNQPLAAIASYAAGSLNMLAQGPSGPPSDPAAERELRELMQQALGRIAEQAERAGRVIKSVHDFVRRREQARESIAADLLFESVMPLVRLQARKSGTRIEIDVPARAPRVLCDRTMVEQVLLNLARNGIQAMETATPQAERVLVLRARPGDGPWVAFSVVDAGPGIAPEVAARLFTPFFTTRSEGMGLGLSLCRTVVEQHGGALDFGPGPDGRGTEFRFTLPAARAAAVAPAAAGAAY